jgi:hypothetical protein
VTRALVPVVVFDPREYHLNTLKIKNNVEMMEMMANLTILALAMLVAMRSNLRLRRTRLYLSLVELMGSLSLHYLAFLLTTSNICKAVESKNIPS